MVTFQKGSLFHEFALVITVKVVFAKYSTCVREVYFHKFVEIREVFRFCLITVLCPITYVCPITCLFVCLSV